jgi:hypothetical protein
VAVGLQKMEKYVYVFRVFAWHGLSCGVRTRAAPVLRSVASAARISSHLAVKEDGVAQARTQHEVIFYVPYISSTAAGRDRMGIAIAKISIKFDC